MKNTVHDTLKKLQSEYNYIDLQGPVGSQPGDVNDNNKSDDQESVWRALKAPFDVHDSDFIPNKMVFRWKNFDF